MFFALVLVFGYTASTGHPGWTPGLIGARISIALMPQKPVFRRVHTASRGKELERAMGIEPTSEAWEASILPLNYARSAHTG